MRDTDAVARELAGRLAEHVPGALAQLAVQNGLCESGDPTPRLVYWSMLPPGTVGVEDWPFLLVVPRATPTMRALGPGPGGVARYDVTYEMRVYVYVRSGLESFQAVQQLRARLTRAVVQALLGVQKVAAGIRVDESSLSESFSDIAQSIEDASSIGAAYVSVLLVSREEVEPAGPPYLVERVIPTAALLPLTGA